MKCSCGCARDAAPNPERSDLSPTCLRRWVDKGRPPGPVAPPFGNAARNAAGGLLQALPDGSCGCGSCGLPAARPVGNPVLSEQCYRRSLQLGLGGYVPPPPKQPRTRRDGGPPRKPDPPKPATKPAPAPATANPAAWASEVLTRIASETPRARAYTHAWDRKDHRGADAVCAKVDDLDAFDALLDAGLDVEKARAALAEQLATQFPETPADETEAAA